MALLNYYCHCRHQAVLESFYASQAHLYDGYRHRMLHGRKPMVSNIPFKKVSSSALYAAIGLVTQFDL